MPSFISRPILIIALVSGLLIVIGLALFHRPLYREVTTDAYGGTPITTSAPLPFFEKIGGLDTSEASLSFDDAAIRAPEAPQERLVTTNGSMAILVKNADETLTIVRASLLAKGGHIRSENRPDNGAYAPKQIFLEARIPSKEWVAFLRDVRDLAVRVESERTDSLDITETVIDIDARLTAMKRQEAAYLELFDRAQKIEDVLAIQRELSSVRGQIESLEAQQRYYKDQVSYSSLSLVLTEEGNVRTTSRSEPTFKEVFVDAVNGLKQLVYSFVVTGIYFGVIGGAILLPVLLVIFLGYRIYKHRTSLPSSSRRR